MPIGNPLLATIKEMMLTDFKSNKWLWVPGTSWRLTAVNANFFMGLHVAGTGSTYLALDTNFPTPAVGDLAGFSAIMVWGVYTYTAGVANHFTWGVEMDIALPTAGVGAITINGVATGVNYTYGANLKVDVLVKVGSWAKWYLNGVLVYEDAVGDAPTKAEQYKRATSASSSAWMYNTQIFFGQA